MDLRNIVDSIIDLNNDIFVQIIVDMVNNKYITIEDFKDGYDILFNDERIQDWPSLFETLQNNFEYHVYDDDEMLIHIFALNREVINSVVDRFNR